MPITGLRQTAKRAVAIPVDWRVRRHFLEGNMGLEAVFAFIDGVFKFVGFVVVSAFSAKLLVWLAVRISCDHCPTKKEPPSKAKSDP